ALPGAAGCCIRGITRPGRVAPGGVQILRPDAFSFRAGGSTPFLGFLLAPAALSGAGRFLEIHTRGLCHAGGSRQRSITLAFKGTFGRESEELAETLLLRIGKTLGHD